MSTNMYRTCVAIPKEMEEELFDLRKRDEFTRCSMSEIVRILVAKSLADYRSTSTTKPA